MTKSVSQVKQGINSVSGITAQVSLYPLRQPHLSPAIAVAQEIFRVHGLEVTTGAMSTMVSGDDDGVFTALRETFRAASEAGDVVMVVTFSNTCPLPPKTVAS